MADPKADVASGYGEADIEAKSMTEAARGKRAQMSPAKVPPPDQAVPAAGTTETDLARNLDEKAKRATKS
jgi:hypothetical protein